MVKIINNKKKRKIRSPLKRKALLLLMSGLALGLTHSSRTQKYIFKNLVREWKNIDRQYLYRIIHDFKYERLVDYRESKDGTVKIVLTEKGRNKALSFKIDEMKIKKPMRWDKKWRVVMFDIPEKRRRERDAIREKLKNLGFHELQKSVFVYPFSCRDEIDFIVEYFQIRNCVRYGELANLTNGAELKLHFGLK
ncbi:MAG TPA: CRISPR-associated endonuclease Cas2 [Candidatus Moranbacteria bacterium]|nr:CRISPR-associated endonuclease Cas2 [Candidatus Moranbacteria bacterium]